MCRRSPPPSETHGSNVSPLVTPWIFMMERRNIEALFSPPISIPDPSWTTTSSSVMEKIRDTRVVWMDICTREPKSDNWDLWTLCIAPCFFAILTRSGGKVRQEFDIRTGTFIIHNQVDPTYPNDRFFRTFDFFFVFGEPFVFMSIVQFYSCYLFEWASWSRNSSPPLYSCQCTLFFFSTLLIRRIWRRTQDLLISC